MINTTKKKKIIEKFRTHKDDTGSSEVQAAILTERINKLTQHLKINKKDNHSRRGLLKMVAKRKKMLKNIKDQSEEKFAQITKSLKIKAARPAQDKNSEEKIIKTNEL